MKSIVLIIITITILSLIIVVVLLSKKRNINISNSENNSIVTNNIVNRSIGENSIHINSFLNNEDVNIYVTRYRLYSFLFGGRVAYIIDLNYKKEYDVLFKNQIIFGNYPKTLFLVRSVAQFTDIIPKVSTRQELLFRRYKRKLTRQGQCF